MTGMSDWMLAGSPLWIWLVALMWLANVVFLVFACRSYLAARAASRLASHPVSPRVASQAAAPPRSMVPTEPGITEPALREPMPVPLMVERFDSASLLVPPEAPPRATDVAANGADSAQETARDGEPHSFAATSPAMPVETRIADTQGADDAHPARPLSDANTGSLEPGGLDQTPSSDRPASVDGHQGMANGRHVPDAEDARLAERFARDYASAFADPPSDQGAPVFQPSADHSASAEQQHTSSAQTEPPGTTMFATHRGENGSFADPHHGDDATTVAPQNGLSAVHVREQAADEHGPAATDPPAGNQDNQAAPDILLAALRRIQERPESARPFRELIRALYLDQSVFTFDCLAELDPGDRQLALALFKAWLAGTYEPERWEEAFQDSQLDSLSKEMFSAVPSDKAV